MSDTLEPTAAHDTARPPVLSQTVRPPEFTCASAETDGVIAIAVAGELDIATVPQLDQALRRAEAGAVLIVLDLRSGVHGPRPDRRRRRRAPAGALRRRLREAGDRG